MLLLTDLSSESCPTKSPIYFCYIMSTTMISTSTQHLSRQSSTNSHTSECLQPPHICHHKQETSASHPSDQSSSSDPIAKIESPKFNSSVWPLFTSLDSDRMACLWRMSWAKFATSRPFLAMLPFNFPPNFFTRFTASDASEASGFKFSCT